MFVLSAHVMGVDSGMETPLSHGENQKIYCTSISAIRLRHVGLYTTRTGWKMKSLSSVSTMKTLKDVLWISILSLPTKLKEQSKITLANHSGVTSLEGKMRAKCFLYLARKGVQPSHTSMYLRHISSHLRCLETVHTSTCTQKCWL